MSSPLYVAKARRGFTLIELLIVVAIIAILAAIAVPNFLEAQTRSKVSRAKADLRTLQTAFALYSVDNNCLPFNYHWATDVPPSPEGRFFSPANGFNYFGMPSLLSTPIAYISSAAHNDPFSQGGHSYVNETYANIEQYFYESAAQVNNFVYTDYWQYYELNKLNVFTSPDVLRDKYATTKKTMGGKIWSMGPDKTNGFLSGRTSPLTQNVSWGLQYDPTNGTTSPGDIGIFMAGGTALHP